MRILCLNVWEGGTCMNVLMPFIRQYAPTIDVFCFQEAYPRLYPCIEALLGESALFESTKYVSPHFRAWQSVLVRSSYRVTRTESVLGILPDTGHSLEVTVTSGTKSYWISNVHGVSRPGDKLDTPERLLQSQALIDEALQRAGRQRILLGDFNLGFDTESIQMFERKGFRNLIKDYGIETTRNHYIWDKFPNDRQMYSDYAFVGPEVDVKHFEVLPDIVSDHQPLLLEIA